MTSGAALVGRILLALIFVLGGLGKIGGFAGTVHEIATHGMPLPPLPPLMAIGAIAVELGCGLMLMVGFQTRLAALALFFYTFALAVIFHAYWAVPPAQARMQHTFFFEHLSMMGGMLAVAAFGPGQWSLDALRFGGRELRLAY